MRYINITGYGLSGSSAVVDILRGCGSFSVVPGEFDLYRAPGGIADLQRALVDQWSTIGSDYAIRRFVRLYKKLAANGQYVPGGMNYERRFNHSFRRLSDIYVKELIDFEYNGRWHFNKLDQNIIEYSIERLISKLGLKWLPQPKIYVGTGVSFASKTTRYVESLLASVCDLELDSIVFHNFCEPSYHQNATRVFHDMKTVVVRRDPRDSFIDANFYYFMPKMSVEKFCRRYSMMYECTRKAAALGSVLELNFEDIVLRYDKSISRLASFIGCESSQLNASRIFKPEVSALNIGKWKHYESSLTSEFSRHLDESLFYNVK